MANQIQAFNFTQAEVRTSTDKNGEPLFCLADVAKILDIQNSRQIVQKQLDSKGVYKIYIPTNSGNQDVTFISEPNLYRVIFRSNKPDAVKFQNWIFEEVIPAIRKTGGYGKTENTIEINFDELSPLSNPNDVTFGVSDYPLRSALDSAIAEVAKCYVDREQARKAIEKQVADICKMPHHSWITRDRFGIALHALAVLSLKANTHKQVLKQIDNNAIQCLEMEIIKTPVIVYQGV